MSREQTFDNTTGAGNLVVVRKHLYNDEPAVNLVVAPGEKLEVPASSVHEYEVVLDGTQANAPDAQPEIPVLTPAE
jgi:hypothetical protein